VLSRGGLGLGRTWVGLRLHSLGSSFLGMKNSLYKLDLSLARALLKMKTSGLNPSSTHL
jgi:hypothetical protein